MITGNNGSRLESWLHAWCIGIMRKSKHRIVSHADMSLISAEDSSSIRHHFFRVRPRKNLKNQLLPSRVQKYIIAAVNWTYLTAYSFLVKNYFIPQSIVILFLLLDIDLSLYIKVLFTHIYCIHKIFFYIKTHALYLKENYRYIII